MYGLPCVTFQIFYKDKHFFPTDGYDDNSVEGYEENLECQCQGNPLFLQIHSGAQVAEICLPANRTVNIKYLFL